MACFGCSCLRTNYEITDNDLLAKKIKSTFMFACNDSVKGISCMLFIKFNSHTSDLV